VSRLFRDVSRLFRADEDTTPARSAPARAMINQSPNEEGFSSEVCNCDMLIEVAVAGFLVG